MRYKNCGLVLEGGAMRGMFTSGILDVLMERDIYIDACVGISAGAAFGCNYKSQQIGRAVRYNKTYCKDRHYHSLYSLITTGDLFNADFSYRKLPFELDLFDTDTFSKSPMQFYIGASDMESGECVFHKCTDGLEKDLLFMRASASMPLVSRIVMIDGKPYLDGGCTDSIPLAFMEGLGFERNVVILTQPKGFVKEKNSMLPLIRMKYRKYPAFVRAMESRHIRYNEELAYIRKREEEGRCFVIQPPEKLNISQATKDESELERVYQIGRRTGEEVVHSLFDFLDSTVI